MHSSLGKKLLNVGLTPSIWGSNSLVAVSLSLVLLLACGQRVRDAATPHPAIPIAPAKWDSALPVYDHVVIVVEENKNFEDIIGSSAAPYINKLAAEGATLTQMYAEEHYSEGNYFWLFSGSRQDLGYTDNMPRNAYESENLGHQLLTAKLSFAGFSESLPAIGSPVWTRGHYARKHVPWVSFSNIPQGNDPATSTNRRFPQDFPKNFEELPTVSFVIPNLIHDMHDGKPPASVQDGDQWLKEHLDAYYQWAKSHNSLLIITFDEDAHASGFGGPTNPGSSNRQASNRIATVLAGDHVKRGEYPEGKGVNHVTLLRTLEAIYKLKRSGHQQANAEAAGISDDAVIMDVFERNPNSR